jgi:hypothetical protein
MDIIKLFTTKGYEELTEYKKAILLDWIGRNLKPSKGFYRKCSSYRLKHYAEADTGFCFSNDQFKVAMLEAGFSASSRRCLNWYFNVSKRSMTAMQERFRREGKSAV